MRKLVFFALSLLATSSFAKNMYIPVAGRVPGANGTFWRTDVRIFNPSAVSDIQVTLHFLPMGLDGSNIPGRLVTVPKRQMVVLDDVVGNFFELPSAIGAVRIDSDTDFSYSFSADSRTYTDSTSGGTFGQFVPAMDGAFKKSVVLHVSRTNAFRTNAGVMNANREPVVVTASLVGADGTLMTPEVALTIPPMSMIQSDIASMFGTTREVANGFILFDATLPVLTWASVIDNQSGDPVFVPGAEDKAEVTPIGDSN